MKDDHGKSQAKAQLASIREMVKELQAVEHSSRHDLSDDAIQRISETPLSVLIRDGWREPGQTAETEEFEILLCTGGPACRIRGELNSGTPENPRLEYQDWGTPWTELVVSGEEEADILTFCHQFYYGEG